MTQKGILAFSGGLDTSVVVKYLQEEHDMDVITVTVDVGQGDDIKKIAAKAKKLGVKKNFAPIRIPSFEILNLSSLSIFLIKEENSPINNVPNRSKVLKAIARTLDDTEFSNLSLIFQYLNDLLFFYIKNILV